MVSAKNEFPSVFGSYQRAIRQLVAVLCETQVCQAATDQCDWFVKAVETGRNDCGLYLGPGTLDRNKGLAHTIHQIICNDQQAKIISPIEIKSLIPANDFRKCGIWRWCVKPDQVQSCQVVIFATPKDPDFIAFLPMYYMSGLRSTKMKHGSMSVSFPSFRPQWTLHPLPAFPPEIVPFLLPVTQLGIACENMRDYIINKKKTWRNAYTGVNFTGAPQPELFDMSVLQPSTSTHTNAQSQFWSLFKYFNTHSRQFRVEFINVSPFLGDMKLIDKISDEEIFIELKLAHCTVVRRGESESEVLRHQQAAFGELKPIFSWKAQWDYIFTATRTHHRGFFLPRDIIPSTWWNASCFIDKSKTKRQLEMLEGFQEFAVDLHNGLEVVRRLENILSRRQSTTGSMRAQKLVPMTHSSHQIDEEDVADEESVEDEGDEGEEEEGRGPEVKHCWSTSDYRRGFGSIAHPTLRGTTYDVWVSEVLTERCRASGRGLIVDFGDHNKICRFAIARYNWSENDRLRYDQDGDPPCRVWNLPKGTPVVPLMFLRFEWTGNWNPCGTRQSENQAITIGGRPGYFVVCDTYPPSSLRAKHARFVCASEHLRPRLLRTHRNLLTRGSIDQFHVENDNLINALLVPLCGQSEIEVGLGRRKVQVAKYCYNIKDIHQAGVDGVREAMKWTGKPGKKPGE